MGAPVFYDDAATSQAARALTNLHEAERHLVGLVRDAGDGATRYWFPNHDADATIANAIHRFEQRQFEFLRALCSEMVGETYRPPASLDALKAALKARIVRNEADQRATPHGPVAQAEAIRGAEQSFLRSAHQHGADLVAVVSPWG
ncbi:hypothetical protein [Methylobacterium durans]|uniref:Uncharacterized protein n=1 Tax=Methylobacterium durans TaxID=2202825 RepID=A0A2U8WAE5_9HYPH|nr:hypothetical protein [Methylobacterium durans]AWN43133.1 hypothetical protein DK389_24875 [Methylobacterium durans]